MKRPDEIKDFYKGYDDRISSKRWKSKYPLRSYAHERQYESVLAYVSRSTKVLDAGCGDGALSFMMAEKGALVTGIDLSTPNINACLKSAKARGLEGQVSFLVGDSEQLPFADNAFDLVVSSHVLEHLPNFDKGLKEVMRVTKKRAIVAIPTIINPSSWVQVGGGWFYLKGPRSFAALPIGFFKMLWALVSLKDGVNESYVGADVPHMFRFPWIMKKKLKINSFKMVEYEASTVLLPYFEFLLPVIKFLDKYKNKPILKNCGYGTTFVIEK